MNNRTSDNVFIFEAQKKSNNGGEPPREDNLEKRVQVLEKFIPEIRDRLTRVELKLDSVEKHNATKEDILTLKSEMNKDFGSLRTETNCKIDQLEIKISDMHTSLIKWFIGTAIAISSIVGAITFGLARLLH